MTPRPAAPPGALSRGRHILFVALTILLAGLAVEVGLRGLTVLRVGPRVLLYGVVPDERSHHTVAVHDDLRADYSKYRGNVELRDFDPLTGETFPVHINAQGFRGADFPEKKRSGTLRVVTLGASSTFGYHARDGQTWPERLEEKLWADCPRTAWQVLNLGIPHLLSEEIAALFLAEALPLEPDIVAFYEGINDASLRRQRHHLRKALRRSEPLRDAYRFLRDHVLFVRFLDEIVRPRARRWDAAAVRAQIADRPPRFLQNLEILRAECARRGILFLVATQQATSLDVPREELRGLSYAAEEVRLVRRLEEGGTIPAPAMAFLVHAELMRAERAWAAEHDVPLVDVVAALDDRRDLLVSWVHLTPEGNERIAGAIAPVILSRLCPPAPEQATAPAAATAPATTTAPAAATPSGP